METTDAFCTPYRSGQSFHWPREIGLHQKQQASSYQIVISATEGLRVLSHAFWRMQPVTYIPDRFTEQIFTWLSYVIVDQTQPPVFMEGEGIFSFYIGIQNTSSVMPSR